MPYFFPQTTTVSSSDPHAFGIYQLTPIGASNTTILTLVSVDISALSYRKVLISKIFFRQILGYTASPTIFVSDLISTITSYFDMNTAMAEREVESASISIRDSIFSVANMSRVGFLDSTEKSITISDPDNRLRDVLYFTFCSSLNPNTIDPCAPHAVYQFKFSLRLPHNSPSSSTNILLPSTSVVTDKSSETTFNATFSVLSEDKLDTLTFRIHGKDLVLLSLQRYPVIL